MQSKIFSKSHKIRPKPDKITLIMGTQRPNDGVTKARPEVGMFPSTRWTLIHQAGASRPTHARNALDELVLQYEPVLKKYIQCVWRLGYHKSEDLLQNFFAEKLIRDRLVQRADQRRGKFRTFLKTVLDNYIRSQIRRDGAKKRAPERAILQLDFIQSTRGTKGPEPSDIFDIEWARALVQQAISKMYTECQESNLGNIWQVFSARLLDPAMSQKEPERYASLVARLEYSSPSQVSDALVKSKRMFKRHLENTMSVYVKDRTELKSEIQSLFQILSKSPT